MRNQSRLGLGLAAGLVAWTVAWRLHAPPPTRALIGWNAGALVFIAMQWRLFLTASHEDLRLRSARRDETRGAIVLLVVGAIVASLGGIVAALMQVRGESATTHAAVMALAAFTLLSSWVVLQTVFASHYAHRHFQAVEAAGPQAGFLFPGDAPRTYLDFAYLAVCIGATAQISDPSVPSTRLRNLVTAHAATSFIYNTAILALGINILSGLIGH